MNARNEFDEFNVLLAARLRDARRTRSPTRLPGVSVSGPGAYSHKAAQREVRCATIGISTLKY